MQYTIQSNIHIQYDAIWNTIIYIRYDTIQYTIHNTIYKIQQDTRVKLTLGLTDFFSSSPNFCNASCLAEGPFFSAAPPVAAPPEAAFGFNGALSRDPGAPFVGHAGI